MSKNVRLPIAVCAAAAKVLPPKSHAILEELFKTAGAPGEPPDMSHAEKWKHWLFKSGLDSSTDSLSVLGTVVEEFMDIPPEDGGQFFGWEVMRDDFVSVLEQHGLRYYRGGQILPIGSTPHVAQSQLESSEQIDAPRPCSADDVLRTIIKGLPRAMHPLTHRRKAAQPLTFNIESDIQDLLHAMLRPWIRDIRAEEYTPSYAGKNTRMDFLLPAYKTVLEVKRVRDRSHSRDIGDELTIDIAHYCNHPDCEKLWCIVYDLENYVANPEGMVNDISGPHSANGREIQVSVTVVSP